MRLLSMHIEPFFQAEPGWRPINIHCYDHNQFTTLDTKTWPLKALHSCIEVQYGLGLQICQFCIDSQLNSILESILHRQLAVMN